MSIRLTESRLRKIIREEARKLTESWHDEEGEAHLQPGPNSAFIVIPGNDWDMTMGDEDYESALAGHDAVIGALWPMAKAMGLNMDGGHEAGLHITGPGAQKFVPVALSYLRANGIDARALKQGESVAALMPRPHNVY